MTTRAVTPRSRARSLMEVFAAPTMIAIASSVGLITALVGDGLMDAIAWIGLSIPIAVSAWYLLTKIDKA